MKPSTKYGKCTSNVECKRASKQMLIRLKIGLKYFCIARNINYAIKAAVMHLSKSLKIVNTESAIREKKEAFSLG